MADRCAWDAVTRSEAALGHDVTELMAGQFHREYLRFVLAARKGKIVLCYVNQTVAVEYVLSITL